MKLRIHGNSVRLRLNRTEVAQFASGGDIKNRCELGTGTLAYGLESSPSAGTIAVRAAGGEIVIVLPATVAKAWVETDQVAIPGAVALGAGKELAVLVEKEFRRLHGANTDPDLYPNPLEGK